MEEHNLKIRGSTDERIRQWATVRQSRFQGFLLKSKDQELVLIPRTPTNEWTDEGD